jgi:hypothetical protein
MDDEVVGCFRPAGAGHGCKARAQVKALSAGCLYSRPMQPS